MVSYTCRTKFLCDSGVVGLHGHHAHTFIWFLLLFLFDVLDLNPFNQAGVCGVFFGCRSPRTCYPQSYALCRCQVLRTGAHRTTQPTPSSSAHHVQTTGGGFRKSTLRFLDVVCSCAPPCTPMFKLLYSGLHDLGNNRVVRPAVNQCGTAAVAQVIWVVKPFVCVVPAAWALNVVRVVP